jgi:hypothetical protein
MYSMDLERRKYMQFCKMPFIYLCRFKILTMIVRLITDATSSAETLNCIR